MKVVIQRVTGASVSIDGSVVGNISKGLLVLAGFECADTDDDLEWMCRKLTGLRIFDDADGVMNLSVKDIGGEILIVSQFTLMASTKKGNRPSYILSAPGEIAEPLYEKFKSMVSADLGREVECGRFGADMKVSLVNDGPVTIIIDTKNKI
ncbi:MAG: D-tyrosyl-tRNA(Tyr) deacylase [Bacteroidales bacterium]|nr:D-tyrosyl-tRNA(Tyr) deacylase [Bacteroidales bacterium]